MVQKKIFQGENASFFNCFTPIAPPHRSPLMKISELVFREFQLFEIHLYLLFHILVQLL